MDQLIKLLLWLQQKEAELRASQEEEQRKLQVRLLRGGACALHCRKPVRSSAPSRVSLFVCRRSWRRLRSASSEEVAGVRGGAGGRRWSRPAALGAGSAPPPSSSSHWAEFCSLSPPTT